MIQIASKNLQLDEIEKLNKLQSQIDNQTTFAEKAKKAQSLWNSKGGAKGKKAFEVIKSELKSMCVFVEVCNYCEQSEANDIEHIYPKSFFPSRTFEWENYILACKQCNSALKLDKFFVIQPTGDVLELIRGLEPTFQEGAFINPRTEPPNNFLILNMQSFKFDMLPGLPKKEQSKAEKTLEILAINQRDLLIEARKSAAIHYYFMCSELIKILNSRSMAALIKNISPYDKKFDFSKSLTELKAEIKESYKKYIQSYQHPSVWVSIKLVESKVTPKWVTIFKKLPEALHW
ncbi:MAG: HNH endonuclease [Saprospiraceae bacterium]|nr:HNH endonuclease [Saprospiraceae bacterium]